MIQYLKEQNHLSKATKQYYLVIFKNLSEFLDKKEVSKQHLVDYFSGGKFLSMKRTSQNTYKRVIKGFLRWKNIPQDFIKSAKSDRQPLRKEDLFTRADIEVMLKNCSRPMERCYVMLSLESACRISEILNVRIKDIVDKGTHYILHITKSKSIKRSIPLIYSVPYISVCINNHPHQQDPEAFLFMNYYGCELTPYAISSISAMLKRICKGIRKRVYPHLFRHTRLTELAKYMTVPELMAFAGWTSQTMITRYVHLAQSDVENKILSIYKIVAPAEPSFIDTKNIICPVCKFHNSFDNKFCAQCGRVLDINTLKDIQDTIKIGNKIMSKQELTAEILRLIQEKTQDEK